jgi:hypothetical protein
MNTDYKLTKYLVNSRNQEFDLSSMLKYEIETFERNYTDKMFAIKHISDICKNKLWIITKESPQSIYFGKTGWGTWNCEGKIQYVGSWRHGPVPIETNPFTGIKERVEFMEEEDLKKLSFHDILRIQEHLKIREKYYNLKNDPYDENKQEFKQYVETLNLCDDDMNFMENIFSESMKLIYQHRHKPITNYQEEMTRLYDIKFEFLDYNIAKDVYKMSVLNDYFTFAKYDLLIPEHYHICDVRITKLMKKLIEQSYVYHQMHRRLSDPLLYVAMMVIEGLIPKQENDETELDKKITNTINYITSQ